MGVPHVLGQQWEQLYNYDYKLLKIYFTNCRHCSVQLKASFMQLLVGGASAVSEATLSS